MKKYTNHMVDESIWPVLISVNLLCLVNGSVLILNKQLIYESTFILALPLTALTFWSWSNNIVIEGTYLGNHTKTVTYGLKLGFILFLLTEVILFFGVFWSWFHGLLSADIIIGSEYPSKGITAVSAIDLPLINTILLLCSASSITYSHHLLISGNNRKSILWSILLTVTLALVFLSLQILEYKTSQFSISDSIYGSVFYISTGLHIIHVIVGTIFLYVNYIRIKDYHLLKDHHLGFESAIIYWHLVDVVWLLLWVIVYWY